MLWQEPEPEAPLCPVRARWRVLTLSDDDHEYTPLRITRGYFRSICPAIRYAMLLQDLRPDLTVVVESAITKERLSVRNWVNREFFGWVKKT